MRAARLASAVLIGVAAVPFAAAPALADGTVSLRLAASHGPAGKSVTAFISYSARSCGGGGVTVQWDGQPVGPPDVKGYNGTCFAVQPITPSGAPGPHTVKASVPGRDPATATFTIDAPPAAPKTTPPAPGAPAPAPGTPQNPSSTRAAQAAQPSRSASPSRPDQPTPSGSSPAVMLPDLLGFAAPTGSAAAGIDGAGVAVRYPAGTPFATWIIAVSGALILIGAALLGALVIRRRRPAGGDVSAVPAVGRVRVTDVTFQ
ncbi:hypothetical protein ACNTMW_16355 [Planosporangium sp. 12N6]|uniref:hypothetical protein n=1 Tax=Planosporangium spinosum TaxID=3402278 RepID=UPI003CED46F5